jgi:hypothetical protein
MPFEKEKPCRDKINCELVIFKLKNFGWDNFLTFFSVAKIRLLKSSGQGENCPAHSKGAKNYFSSSMRFVAV